MQYLNVCKDVFRTDGTSSGNVSKLHTVDNSWRLAYSLHGNDKGAAIETWIKSHTVHETVMCKERLRAKSIKILVGLCRAWRQEQVECILMGLFRSPESQKVHLCWSARERLWTWMQSVFGLMLKLLCFKRRCMLLRDSWGRYCQRVCLGVQNWPNRMLRVVLSFDHACARLVGLWFLLACQLLCYYCRHEGDMSIAWHADVEIANIISESIPRA